MYFSVFVVFQISIVFPFLVFLQRCVDLSGASGEPHYMMCAKVVNVFLLLDSMGTFNRLAVNHPGSRDQIPRRYFV